MGRTGATASLRGAALLAAVVVACAARNPAAHRFDRLVDGRRVRTAVPPAAAYAAYLRAGLSYGMHRSPDEVLAHLDEVAALDPGAPHPWVLRARVLAEAGRRSEARAALSRALALAPGYPPARALAARLRGPGPGQRVSRVPGDGERRRGR